MVYELQLLLISKGSSMVWTSLSYTYHCFSPGWKGINDERYTLFSFTNTCPLNLYMLPSITSITHSQSFSDHIFLFSPSFLFSFINLNILYASRAVLGKHKGECAPWCVFSTFPFLFFVCWIPLHCWRHSSSEGDISQQYSALWHWCVLTSGESGRMSPSGGLFKC